MLRLRDMKTGAKQTWKKYCMFLEIKIFMLISFPKNRLFENIYLQLFFLIVK